MSLDLLTASGMMLALLPEFVLVLFGCSVMLLAGWRHKTAEDQRLAGHVTLVALVVTLGVQWWLWSTGARPDGLAHMVAVDPFRHASSTIFLLGAVLAVLTSLGYVGRERIFVPEYYVLLIFATVGMMLMAAASDLIVLFLAIELMSICVYVLVGINRRSAHGAEGALKYFLLGAFASGFLLYGIALLYGATGTTNLTSMSARINDLGLTSEPMLVAGIALLLIGFGFKVAAVPFHMWTPDVYDGAPTPITGFMAAAVKAAGFAALFRVLVHGLGDIVPVWQDAVWWLAAVTMVAGNLMALAQRRLKRMLAYSSVGHAGYLLTAAVSGSIAGAQAFLFYALAYTLMTIGAFTIVAALGRDGERDVLIDDLAGLASRRPWIAFSMAVFMLSLLGFPGTAGFIGKWVVLSSIIDAGHWTLAITLVVASVVSAGYYLPVIMQMYMREAASDESHRMVEMLGAARWVVGGTAALLLLLGVWPNAALQMADDASRDLRPTVEFTRTIPR